MSESFVSFNMTICCRLRNSWIDYWIIRTAATHEGRGAILAAMTLVPARKVMEKVKSLILGKVEVNQMEI